MLQYFWLRTQVFPAFVSIFKHSQKKEIMHRDWIEHRQDYLKRQIVVHWRQHSVRQKLAKMFTQRRVMNRFKQNVFSKTREIPLSFWTRYRQIMFFKVMKQLTRHKVRPVSNQRSYRVKLQKKVLICLLQNIFSRKKK